MAWAMYSSLPLAQTVPGIGVPVAPVAPLQGTYRSPFGASGPSNRHASSATPAPFTNFYFSGNKRKRPIIVDPEGHVEEGDIDPSNAAERDHEPYDEHFTAAKRMMVDLHIAAPGPGSSESARPSASSTTSDLQTFPISAHVPVVQGTGFPSVPEGPPTPHPHAWVSGHNIGEDIASAASSPSNAPRAHAAHTSAGSEARTSHLPWRPPQNAITVWRGQMGGEGNEAWDTYGLTRQSHPKVEIVEVEDVTSEDPDESNRGSGGLKGFDLDATSLLRATQASALSRLAKGRGMPVLAVPREPDSLALVPYQAPLIDKFALSTANAEVEEYDSTAPTNLMDYSDESSPVVAKDQVDNMTGATWASPIVLQPGTWASPNAYWPASGALRGPQNQDAMEL